MKVHISPDGTLTYLYTEDVDLYHMGEVTVSRLSNIEPVGLEWEVIMRDGTNLGRYPKRSQALKAEVEYLEKHLGEF